MKRYIGLLAFAALAGSLAASCSVDIPNADGYGTHKEYATDDGVVITTPPPPPPPPPKGLDPGTGRR